MPDLQRLHLRRATGLAAALDHPGDRVVDPHERQRAGRGAAAGKLFPLAADRRQVGPGARSELEQHRLAARQTHDVFHVVVDALDEARRALGVLVRVLRLFGRLRFRIPTPIAFGSRHAVLGVKPDVEPHGAVERAVLVQTKPRQLAIKAVAVFGRVEVSVFQPPVGDRAGHAMDQLADRTFPLVRPLRVAVEIFRDDDVGRQLRPARRDLAIGLLEQRLARVVLDRRAAVFPRHRREGRLAVVRAKRRADLEPRTVAPQGAAESTPCVLDPVLGVDPLQCRLRDGFVTGRMVRNVRTRENGGHRFKTP